MLHAENESEFSNFGISSSWLLNCESLKNLKAFAIHPQYSIDSASLQNKVDDFIALELGKLGTVIKVKVPDLTGYGKSQAHITMIFKDISNSKDQKFPVSEMSFLISSATLIEKTKVKCQSYIWILQSVIDGNIEDQNSGNILNALKASLDLFIDEYRKINKEQKDKPVFYLYIP